MNEELYRVLEENVVSFPVLDPGLCLEELRSTTNKKIKTAKFCVDIRTRDLGNTKELITVVPRKSANLTF
jgi:hypothetical protein